MSDHDQVTSRSEINAADHLQALRKEVAQLRQESIRSRETAEASIAETRRVATDRIIRAELRAAAGQAGMIDLDGLKMADLSGVTLDDAGVVQGADDVLTALRKNKPYLFGASGAAGGHPKPAGGKPRHASEMSKEEFERELQKLIRR